MPPGKSFYLKNLEYFPNKLISSTFQISSNAGVDASVIVNKVIEAKEANMGYDAQNGEFVDMIEAGIIDPTKVRNHAYCALKKTVSLSAFIALCPILRRLTTCGNGSS